MKADKITSYGLMVTLASAFAILYGEIRVFTSEFGLTLLDVARAVLLPAIFALPGVLLILLLKETPRVRAYLPRALPTLALAVLLTTAVETHIMLDERHFRQEVATATIFPVSHHRERVWPYSGTSLHYHSDRGYWAND